LAQDAPQERAPGFWQRPAFKWTLAAVLVVLAAGMALTGWLTHVAPWLVGAAGVLAVLVIVEGAIAAQALFWERRRQAAMAWATVEERMQDLLPQLKADYWRGNHYGRHGLETSWRWRNALADRAASLWAGLPAEARVFSQDEVREALARQTMEAVAADPYWVFYSPTMARADFVHYCRLVLEEYGWTVVAPRPGCFQAADLAADLSGEPVLLRCDLVTDPPNAPLLHTFAGEARAHGFRHAVLVLDGALHHELRLTADDLGLATYRHDDLAVLAANAGQLPTVSAEAASPPG
jgi:hypothetical protein